jgi:hypothetical protein
MEDVFINAVFRRRPLWDPNHDLHKHIAVLRREWEEVAEETAAILLDSFHNIKFVCIHSELVTFILYCGEYFPAKHDHFAMAQIPRC